MSRRRRLLGGVAGSWFCLLTCGAAHAAELAGATLDTESAAGAESCPSAEALKDRTLALGIPPQEPREPLLIHVAFRRDGDDFAATVRTSGRTAGERELTAAGPDCNPLAAATAVMLAVLLDLRPRESVAEPAPKPLPPAPPLKRDSSGFRHVSLGGELAGAFGLLGPAFSMVYAGDARARFSFLELALGGFGLVDREVGLPPGTVDVGLAGGDLGLCAYFWRAGRVDVAACASLALGRFHGTGQGFFIDKNGASLWIAGGLGATLGFELSRHWALRLDLDALVPFRQYRPEVELVGTAYHASPLAGTVGFGPEFRFP
ncbi:MAG TPA: hypothetical protein VMI54_10870 [Polyangiaceae bacterium]|nr:hypothetical protein [Polyangiaceae bacterium]